MAAKWNEKRKKALQCIFSILELSSNLGKE